MLAYEVLSRVLEDEPSKRDIILAELSRLSIKDLQSSPSMYAPIKGADEATVLRMMIDGTNNPQLKAILIKRIA